MAVESFTENMTLQEMRCNLGENPFGFIYPQGSIPEIEKIELLLKRAGGKPIECALDDYKNVGNGKAKPEYIITFKDDQNTIIVVECKNVVSKHSSPTMNKPRHFAVDGALYYAKFLKEDYNVIALAISGTSKDKMKSTAYQWLKGQDTFSELKKARDIILEPTNYVKLFKGDKLQKQYSIEEIRSTAIDMHNKLREIKVAEKYKPIFIAGILIALENESFSKEYQNYTSFTSVINNLISAIDDVLDQSDIKKDKIQNIKNSFRIIKNNEKLKMIPLGQTNSITWYIEQLELKIKPMMDHSESTLDALGVFYHEFVKYSGGDGSGLGIVLTPQHLTEFMVDLAGVNKNSKVVDIACGSGSFLVSALSKMTRDANAQEIIKIKHESLYGVELDPDLFTLAIANMIIRKDGKSNIIHGDCFNKSVIAELKTKNINIGLLNPPYSQKDISELEFVEQLLNTLVPGGRGVVVVPMSCAIGTKFTVEREKLLQNHTLKAVFSMPNDIFYPTGTNVCVMVWDAHVPHDSSQDTFFGYYKDDGFQKRKKIGRVDVNSRWDEVKAEWLRMYRNLEVHPGKSAKRAITHQDEWLVEAYMHTDYSKLTKNDFEVTVRNFLSYLIKYDKAELKTKNLKVKTTTLCTSDWKDFKLITYFDMFAGRYYYKDEYNEGLTPYVSASDMNNGIQNFIDITPRYRGNSITIGKVGCTTFYQPDDFCATSDVTILIPKQPFNKYMGLFLTTVINLERYKWNFGRQIRLGDSTEMVISLPHDEQGEPDWQYMENYIKSLKFSEHI